MTQSPTGTNMPSSHVAIQTNEVPHVVPRGLPKDLYEITDFGVLVVYEGFETTGWESEFDESETSDITSLLALYERSGLTWNQIATLFRVTMRMVHYWVSGEKPMTTEQGEVARILVELLNTLNLGPAFRAKKFLQEKFLTNPLLMELLDTRNFFELDRWAQEVQIERYPQKKKVSVKLLNNQLPDSPFTLLSQAKDEVIAPIGKTKSARIRRHRKRE